MAKHSTLKVAGGVLDAYGVAYTVKKGRHYKIMFLVNGKQLCYVGSKTSSDCRTMVNCRAEVRRMLRAEGLTPL